MKYIFIVNPCSGNKDYTIIKQNIDNAMNGKDYKIWAKSVTYVY